MTLIIDLQQYLNQQINKINKSYNTSKYNQTNYYNKLINSINASKNLALQKQKQIILLNTQLNIILTGLKNKLNIDIQNMQNYVNSLIVNKLPENTDQIKSKYALLVGINYINTSKQLNGCINDINIVRQILISHGFNNQSITVLTDDSTNLTNTNSSLKPTKTNILNQLTNLLKNSKTGDILFFQYSGHGSTVPDKNGDELIINNKVTDQVIFGSDFSFITDDELKICINTYLKKDVTLIALFDSCFSGSVLDLRYQYMDTLNSNILTINMKESETIGNVIMISGSNDTQTSAEAFINGKYDGAMTYCFLNILKTYTDTNQVLSWRTLVQNMRDLLSENNFTQIPQISSGNLINLDTKIFF
jgi:hypothetical protein